MTEDEFKRHLYKQMAEDKKNERVLTHQLYRQPKPKNSNKYVNEKYNKKNPN